MGEEEFYIRWWENQKIRVHPLMTREEFEVSEVKDEFPYENYVVLVETWISILEDDLHLAKCTGLIPIPNKESLKDFIKYSRELNKYRKVE